MYLPLFAVRLGMGPARTHAVLIGGPAPCRSVIGRQTGHVLVSPSGQVGGSPRAGLSGLGDQDVWW